MSTKPAADPNGDGSWREPDFTFADAAGQPILWEHLGMMDLPDYAAGWARKKRWYEDNGFVEGRNLFTTTESGGGLQMAQIAATFEKIEALC